MSLELFHLLVVIALAVVILGLGCLFVHYRCIERAMKCGHKGRTG